jgi:polyferredoxin
MALGTQREKVVYGLRKARGTPHRYTVTRWIVGVLFTLGVALLPLTGVLRFDLWGGRHMWLGEEVGLVEVAKAFAFPFLAINVLIVVASRFVGRYLCGFVCPYAAVARLAEWFRWRDRRGHGELVRRLERLLASALLSAITFSFWIDWRVFTLGSTFAAGVSAALLVGLTAALYLSTDRLGLLFCQRWCPSGVYFAVLGPQTTNSVELANPDACTDCGACETSCPMDLPPRSLAAEDSRPGAGLYPDGLPGHALCIRCGDCVVACEGMTRRDPEPTPLRMGFLSSPPHGAVERAEPPGSRRAAS